MKTEHIATPTEPIYTTITLDYPRWVWFCVWRQPRHLACVYRVYALQREIVWGKEKGGRERERRARCVHCPERGNDAAWHDLAFRRPAPIICWVVATLSTLIARPPPPPTPNRAAKKFHSTTPLHLKRVKNWWHSLAKADVNNLVPWNFQHD